jgi:hypothetical protein
VAEWEKWPSNLPLEDQVNRLADVLLDDYADYFDRSEGAMEKAARLLWEIAHNDGTLPALIDGSDALFPEERADDA